MATEQPVASSVWTPVETEALNDGGFEREQAKWAARLVGAGSALTLLFQIAYVLFDWRFLSINQPKVLIFHSVNIALYAIAVAASVILPTWLRLHWKGVAFLFSCVMLWSSAAIAILTRQTEPLFLTVILFLAGTGTFLSWGGRIQALLSAAGIVAYAAAIWSLSIAIDPYQWLGLAVAAAIGVSSAALLKGLRRARRRARAELLESRERLAGQERVRMIGQLASGIAHDLNNSLHLVKLRLTALKLDKAISQSHWEKLAIIDSAIEDAARTVARVAELGRTREPASNESVDLSEVIGQAIDLARTGIEGRPGLKGPGIRVQSNVSGSLPQVAANASDLRRVFLNLLLNASEAINGEGTIIIEAVERQEFVSVNVIDDGCGIPEDHLTRIFEPFYTTKGARGTGLGLSVVQEIVCGIGGSVSAENRAQRGAIFTLNLPYSRSHARSSTHALPASASPCNLLLIDDDADNLNAATELLATLGHRADTALSGGQALEMLQSRANYDLVLCDLGMPGMNGWEVASKARKIAPDLPFFILTGWGKQMPETSPVPVTGVLSKPLDLTELQRIVTTVASNVNGSAMLKRCDYKL